MTSPVEDFEYEFNDGEVEITGYIGSDLEIVVPSIIENRPVTEIGYEAFEGYDMKSIVIPDSVIEIDDRAFENCSNLSNIVFSENLELISSCAFWGCDSLESIIIPDSVRIIGSSSFYCCSSLKSVTMSRELYEECKDDFIGTPLDTGIFYGCSNELKINGVPYDPSPDTW